MVRWGTEGKTDFFFNTLSFMSLWQCYLPKTTSVNNYNINKSLIRGGSREWHSGESARLPPMWPRNKSRLRHHMWTESVVRSLPCSERFFFGYSGFPHSSKTNISKFQFAQESGRRRTTLWMCYLQIIIHVFIYLVIKLYIWKLQESRAHVQGSHKGSWPFTSQVDYKVRRRAQNMSGCQNCHQQGRWHVEWREKMRDCIYPFLTSRLSEHKKNELNGTVRVDDSPGKAVHYY